MKKRNLLISTFFIALTGLANFLLGVMIGAAPLPVTTTFAMYGLLLLSALSTLGFIVYL